jgi:hypothetical protein
MGIGGKWDVDAALGRMKRQLTEQPGDFDRPTRLEHIIEGVDPFPRFDGVEIHRVFGSYLSHD